MEPGGANPAFTINRPRVNDSGDRSVGLSQRRGTLEHMAPVT